MSKQYSIVHAYSDSNKGDLAIVWGMIAGLRVVDPGCRVWLHSVFSTADPDFDWHCRHVRSLGVNVCQMAIPSPYISSNSSGVFGHVAAGFRLALNSAAAWLDLFQRRLPWARGFKIQSHNILASSDLVILKGGQYIYNDQGGLRGSLYLWRMLSPIWTARALKKPVAVLGQSIGPLNGRWALRSVSRALSHCKKVVVREEFTKNLLVELGCSAVELRPDFAFLVQPSSSAKVDGVVREIAGRKCFGLTVVNWYFPGSCNVAASRAAYEEALFNACVELHQAHGFLPVIVPQVTVRHHGESDLDVIDRLAIRLRARSVPFVNVSAELDLNPEELASLYGGLAFLIGTRLHSCILAACASCPVLAIRYQGFKTQGVMAQLGMSENVFDISSLDARALVDAALRTYECRAKLSSGIHNEVARARVALAETLASLA